MAMILVMLWPGLVSALELSIPDSMGVPRLPVKIGSVFVTLTLALFAYRTPGYREFGPCLLLKTAGGHYASCFSHASNRGC
jgi:hypothetical protein